MKKINFLFLALTIFVSSSLFAQRGKDGNVTVNTANRIVNEYTTLTSNVAAGATTIPVAASGLNANARFSTTLQPGDLIMIIQMQGISINGSSVEFPAGSGQFYGLPNDKTWGAITSYNNCGNYEFAQVKSVPNSTSIEVDCGLTYSYTSLGRAQIIRVPRYNTLTVTSPGTITGQNWAASGFTGGVIAIEVLGNTIINNANGITASGIGFRGGSLVGDNASGLGGGQFARNDNNEGAEKGEGVYGYQADYNAFGGRYARGVAGNAGGGANCHNSGGGGGANAANPSIAWDGEGNPDISGPSWSTAWDLEGASFSTHVSSGGGRGGYSFANTNQNAITLAPRPFQGSGTNAWGGDYRTNNGGLGGRPLDYSTGKLFLGGGGGAGDQDNNASGAGGRGAGLVYLMAYGTVSGTGSIVANGAAGSNSGIDGAGGGGAGGTIVINAVGTISGISASANGGAGGNQSVAAFVTESEGPGGGGGGGYIAVSNGAITQTVNPGANGTTNSTSLSEFTPNGATRGYAGLSGQSITSYTFSIAGTTICSGNTATLNVTTSGTVPGGLTFNWYTSPTGGSPVGTGTSFTTPVLSTTTSYYVEPCPGTYREIVTVTVTPGPSITVNSPTICNGQTANLTANGGTTYSWTAGVTVTGTNTGDASPSSTTSYTVTGTTAGCSGTAVSTVTVTPGPTITVNSPTICNGQTANLTAGGGTSYTWSAGATSTGTNTASASPTSNTTYTVTGTVGTCSNTAIATVTVTPLPTITVNSPTICNGQTANLTAGGGTSYTWSAGATSTGTNTADASPSSNTTYTVTGTVGSCSNTAIATVTVTPLPTITVNSPTICNGQTANLTAGGGTSYTWSAGATSTGTNTADASPSSNTTYTVTGTVGSCSNTAIATVTVTPLPTITVNSPTICNGQTANLTAGGGTSYTWSAGATSTGTNTADASPSSNTTYTVTGTVGSCSNTAIATVTVTPLPTITVNSPTICNGQTANLTAGGGTSYTWSAGATSTGTNTADASPASTTSYTVTGTAAGCSNTAVATVTVAAALNITVNSPTICNGQTASLTAGGATSYTWSAGATSTGTNTADASPTSTTTYTVTGTSGSCSGTATTTITVNPVPVVTVNSPSICSGQTASLTAGGATSYTWSVGATPTGTNTADASPTSTTTYTVTGTSLGCSDSAIATVTVGSALSITVNSPTICNGQTANLTAGGGTTYTWSAGASSTGTNTADASPTTTTTYTVTGTTGACSGTATATVTVNALPTVLISGTSSICSGQNTSLTASGASTYVWNTTSTSNPLTVSPTSTTTYTVTGTDANGCVNTATQTVTVNTMPVADAGNDVTICSGTSVLLTASGGANFVWSNGPTTANNTVAPTATTTYFVTVANGSCTDNDTVTITVNTTPTAGVSPDITITQGTSTTIVATGGGTYLWNDGSTTPLITVSPNQTTQYCVTVSNGICTDSVCMRVIVDMVCGELFVPNAFSPNNDLSNDRFRVKVGNIACVQDVQLVVFDRWGEKVFEATAPQFACSDNPSDNTAGWDGTYNGKALDNAVFVYYLTIKLSNSTDVIKQKGNVSLIR